MRLNIKAGWISQKMDKKNSKDLDKKLTKKT